MSFKSLYNTPVKKGVLIAVGLVGLYFVYAWYKKRNSGAALTTEAAKPSTAKIENTPAGLVYRR